MDQLNLTLSLDAWTTDRLKALAPHKSVFGLNAPREVSGNLSMPKPVIASIANFMSSEIDVDPVKLQRMEALV